MRLTLTLTLLLVFVLSAGADAQKMTIRIDAGSLDNAFQQIMKTGNVQLVYNSDVAARIDCPAAVFEQVELSAILNALLANTNLGYRRTNDVYTISSKAPQQEQPQILKQVTGQVLDEAKAPLPGAVVNVKGDKKKITAADTQGRFRLTDVPANAVLEVSYIGYEPGEFPLNGRATVEFSLQPKATNVDEVVVTGYQVIDKRQLTSSIQTIKMEEIDMPQVTTIDKMLESHVPGAIFMQNSGQVGATPRIRIRGTSSILGNQEPLWVVDGIVYTEPVNIPAESINNLDFVNLIGNAISGLNPNDIAQIDILKDASATALYGVRAANGVIVITTKKGVVGTPRISYNFSGYFTSRPHYSDKAVNMMNSRERVDYSREAYEKRLTFPQLNSMVGYEAAMLKYAEGLIDFTEFHAMVSAMETRNTDWFDLICQNSFSQNHTVSVSGGSSTARYYASIGYNDEVGVLRGESKKRYTANARLVLNHNKFKGSFGINGNLSRSEHAPDDLGGMGLMSYAYNTSRTIPAFDENGGYYFYKKVGERLDYATNTSDRDFNILHDRDHSYRHIDVNEINMNAMLGYNFLKTLDGEVTVAYNISNTKDQTHYGEQTFYARNLMVNDQPSEPNGIMRGVELPYGGELRNNDTQKYSYTVRAQLNYRDFLDGNQNHLIFGSIGGEASSTWYEGFNQHHRAYMMDQDKEKSPVDPVKYPAYANWLSMNKFAIGDYSEQLTNLVSAYATVSYSYQDRYIFNVNARIDASNKFGKYSNDKLLPIWSASTRWNTKKDVLQNVRWVDDLAFKASFGYQGNMLESESPELVIKKGKVIPFFNEYSSTIAAYPNPNLKWEKTMSLNFATEFAFLKNAIRGNFAFFYKKTTDAFLTKEVSTVNGVPSMVVNQGDVENYGFEVAFNFTPIGGMDGGRNGFRWNIDPGFGEIINRLLNKTLERRQEVLHDEYHYGDYLDGNVQVAGKPLNSFYSYRFMGLNPVDGRPMYYGIDDDPELAAKLKNMGTLEEAMLAVTEYSGSRVPVLQGGVGNTFSYKGLSLNVYLGYSIGSKVRLLRLYPNTSGVIVAQPDQNLRAELVNRWRTPGDEEYTKIPGLLPQDAFKKTYDGTDNWWTKAADYGKAGQFSENIWQMYDDSDLRVVSGDYLKLQSLTLRYIIPQRICDMLTIQSANVSFTGTNLYTWCSKELRGQDPTQSGTTSIINLGIRPTYSLNLSLTF